MSKIHNREQNLDERLKFYQKQDIEWVYNVEGIAKNRSGKFL